MHKPARDLIEEQRVDIHFDGKAVTVAPSTVQVRLGIDCVHWFLVETGAIKSIKFKKHPEPFRGDHDVLNSREVISDVVLDKKHVRKTFKYTVVVTDSNGSPFKLDPGVEVMPFPLDNPPKTRKGGGK